MSRLVLGLPVAVVVGVVLDVDSVAVHRHVGRPGGLQFGRARGWARGKLPGFRTPGRRRRRRRRRRHDCPGSGQRRDPQTRPVAVGFKRVGTSSPRGENWYKAHVGAVASRTLCVWLLLYRDD